MRPWLVNLNPATRNYTTLVINMQHQTQGINWLYARGWTVRQAAKKLGVSYSHVAYVLRGERKSKRLLDSLRALPQRTLNLRERLTR